jgi:hypothetical protein
MIKMIELLKLIFSQNKALIIGIIISLLIHFLFLSKFLFILPKSNGQLQALDVHLVNFEPIQRTKPIPTKYLPTNSGLTTKPPDSKSKLELELSEANKISNISDVQKIQDERSTEISNIPFSKNLPPVDPTVAISSPKDTIVSDEIIEFDKPVDEVDAVKKPIPHAYNYVETEFEISKDNNSNIDGTARIVFKINENSTYMITSFSEASGLISFFLGTLFQKSEGVVLDSGLRPNSYTYQYGGNAKKIHNANFAWSDGILEMTNEKDKKIEILASGTQDLLSFMYQFMFMPPFENTEITITNGKTLNTYTYNFLGEDQTRTKLGILKTIHLQNSGINDEKTDLWLAIDYQYLPVKIRKTEKDNSFIEQIASKISTSAP